MATFIPAPVNVDGTTLQSVAGVLSVKYGGGMNRIFHATNWSIAGPSVAYASVFQLLADNATETSVDDVCTKAFTVTGVSLNLLTNVAAGDKVFTLRKNGADTTLTATVPAGTTGPVAFTGAAVSFAAGDLICLKAEATGTGGTSWDTIVLAVAP